MADDTTVLYSRLAQGRVEAALLVPVSENRLKLSDLRGSSDKGTKGLDRGKQITSSRIETIETTRFEAGPKKRIES